MLVAAAAAGAAVVVAVAVVAVVIDDDVIAKLSVVDNGPTATIEDDGREIAKVPGRRHQQQINSETMFFNFGTAFGFTITSGTLKEITEIDIIFL